MSDVYGLINGLYEEAVMSITSTTNELLLCIHGIEMKFSTNSPELADSVETLLHHFVSNVVVAQPVRMQFDAVDHRRDIPAMVNRIKLHPHGLSYNDVGYKMVE